MTDKDQEISSALMKAMGYKEKEELDDCCINILTELTQYNFCFINFEEKDYLAVWVTHEDFTERLVLIKKEYIISISIVYEQDVAIEESDENVYFL